MLISKILATSEDSCISMEEVEARCVVGNQEIELQKGPARHGKDGCSPASFPGL